MTRKCPSSNWLSCPFEVWKKTSPLLACLTHRMGCALLSFHGFTPLCLALLIGIKWAQESLGCPAGCTCEQWTVNCKGKNLHTVPDNIPLTTKELILANNNITELPIIEINYLSELVYLDLSHNQLTMSPQFVFCSTNHLVYLDLSFNRLTHIYQNTLSQLGKLMLLNLSGNTDLTLIEKEAFMGTHMLASLDVSGCDLSYVDDDVFEHLGNLHTLGIHNNPWRCDCALLELCTWIEETAIELSNPEDILCKEPSFLQGHQLLGTVKEELHHKCLVHLETHDFLNMSVLAICIFLGGTLVAWLVGISTVMYHHPTMKTDDVTEEEEDRMI